jgi:two-component system, NarL family, sensor kinase
MLESRFSPHNVSWFLCGLCALLLLAPLPLIMPTIQFVASNSQGPILAPEVVFISDLANRIAVFGLTFLGTLVITRAPNRIGWLFCLLGCSMALEMFVAPYSIYALVLEPKLLPGGYAAGWLQSWLWIVTSALLILYLPLLFPNGRYLSARWRRFGWLIALVVLGLIVDMGLMPRSLGNTFEGLSPAIPNPLGLSAAAFLEVEPGFWLLDYLFVLFLIFIPVALGSLVLRLLRAKEEERQQVKWVAYFGALMALLFLAQGFIRHLLDSSSVGFEYLLLFSSTAAMLGLPLSLAIAIFKHQLWDVDIIIQRTLVYGVLTASLILLYMLTVSLFGAIFQIQTNLLISLPAMGLVAVLFQPLRIRLQRAIVRLLYGEWDEPYQVIARLGERLEAAFEPSAILPAIVQTVRESLNLSYVAIELAHDETCTLAAATGDATQLPLRLPITYQGATAGYLLIAPRRGETILSPTERQLLNVLAQQAGAAVHGVSLMADLQRLTTDLQHSRERLILAREEERRRLRRDLHDDLAPTLAGLSLTANTIGALIPVDPSRALALTDDLQLSIRGSVQNIRRLVYDLRPPALDEFGLIAAIRERAAQYNDLAGTPSDLQVLVEAPDQLPLLPAAVEVAAYRIVQEALMNVVRHAQARTCQIHISFYDALTIEITDDGAGLAGTYTPGVGLRSMRERATELGGLCEITRQDASGTRVFVSLPVPKEPTDEPPTHLDR